MKALLRPLACLLAVAAMTASAIAAEGKVLSAIDTDMYTYVEVDTGTRTVWIAGPKVRLEVGNTVSYDDGPMMTNSHSKQLNRVFPAVMFVPRVAVVAGR